MLRERLLTAVDHSLRRQQSLRLKRLYGFLDIYPGGILREYRADQNFKLVFGRPPALRAPLVLQSSINLLNA